MKSAQARGCGRVGVAWAATALVALACTAPQPGRVKGAAGAASVGGSAGAGSETPEPTLDPGWKGIHRLNSTEYNATVKDVLGAALQPASASWRGGEGDGSFDNLAGLLGIDETLYDRYFKAAQALAVEVMADATQRSRIIACSIAEPECARASIAAAGLRVFRRPLEGDELATYLRVYTAAREQGDDGDAAFTLSLQALLSSAEFLYRIEIDPQPDSMAAHPLGPYELASRLSYFLWSSAPDDQLLEAAAADKLSQPGELSAVVERLLKDPKSERFVTNFAGQWLGARQLPAHVATSKLDQWSPRVARAASQEMLLYFGDFLNNERSWFEFPTADFNYINAELALLYGIPTALTGYTTFERVEYSADQRRGFLGLVGFLALSSYERRTSPSIRGHWVVGKLLCQELPPPPPKVPMLDSNGPSGEPESLNVRERLEEHRREPTCAVCHSLFDAYGLALEQYDNIGVYRSSYDDGTLIDASATLPGSEQDPEGVAVDGLDGLATALAKDPRFGHCLAQKLMTYGLGRLLGESDPPHLERAEQVWLAPGETPSLHRLIQALVASDAFRLRRGGK